MDEIAGLAKRFSLQGQIIVWSRTCRVFTIGMRDRIRLLEEKSGIPSVILECDTCDTRLTSETAIDHAIEAFMEILANRESTKR